jgi:23S rRNA (cytosine1962-C5)-methyltransferase
MSAEESMPAVADDAPLAVTEPVLPLLRLKRGEDRRLRAGHLWVYSNEVDISATPLTAFAPGAHARVQDWRDQFLGYAYVNPHALICARLLSRSPVQWPDRSLLVHRL